MLEYDIEEISQDNIKECYSKKGDIQFVGYTDYDARCNLCSGTLTLNINGKTVTFGRGKDYPDFFSPAKCISDASYVKENVSAEEWNVDVKVLPEQYRPYAKQIHDLLNIHMPKDFCIGCD